jgi:phosphoribosylglycinamide formyltransferase-1
MARWAVFLSGTGSNFQALLELNETCALKLVVTDKANARGVSRAKLAGIPVLILSKPIDWNSVLEELRKLRVQNIFLLGFMRIIPAAFLSEWQRTGTIINLHPSLLPAYPGLHSIEAAFKDGNNESSKIGVTVHHVIAEVDRGDFILQKQCRFRESTLPRCEFQVHRLEHRMVRKVIEKWKNRLIS